MQTTKKTGLPVLLARVLFTGCLAYSLWFIFRNSLQAAQVSAQYSEQVRQAINQAAGAVGLGPFTLRTVRKLAHFAEFTLLGFWLMLCLRVYTRHFIKHVSWPLLFGLLAAVADETVQLYVPGRISSTLDVLLDFSGVVCGLFAALVLLLFLRMCHIVFVNRNRE